MDIHHYGEQLREAGFRVVTGSQNSLWSCQQRFAIEREPHWALHLPDPAEIAGVFKQSNAPLLSFATLPTNDRPPNSFLYLCTDADYSIDKLAKGPRYDVRRGLAELTIRSVEQAEILSRGWEAFRDTRTRTGLSDGTRRAFEMRFGAAQPTMKFAAAFKGDSLAAFFGATEVEGCAWIEGCSADEFLTLRPNNALVYFLMRHYLVERKFRLVSYGLRSVQAVSNAEGLHKFKVKMGFEAIPVHRAFIVNPLWKPIINRGSWMLTHTLLKIAPHNTALKKAEGALRLAVTS